MEKTIADYLTDLVQQRKNLASNLTTMGVASEQDELFNDLVPKVLNISGSGYGVVGDCLLYPDGIVDEGIVGEYTDLSYTGYVPDGMPYADGLVQWFDFSSYVGEETVENPCSDFPLTDSNLTIIGGTAGDNELVLQGTSSSYAKCTPLYDGTSVTVYVISKSDAFAASSTWWSIWDNSYSRSKGQSFGFTDLGGVLSMHCSGSGIEASETSMGEYSVIAFTKDGSKLLLYWNGVYQGKNSGFNGCGSTVTLGVGNYNGTIDYYHNNPIRFKAVAHFNTVHTAEQIAANSTWLTEKFLSEVE